jgi:hypothetical protein
MDPEFSKLARVLWEHGFDCGWQREAVGRIVEQGPPLIAALWSWHVAQVAAAREAGRVERERLRAALTPFTAPEFRRTSSGCWLPEHGVYGRDGATLTLGDFQRAAAALLPSGPDATTPTEDAR